MNSPPFARPVVNLGSTTPRSSSGWSGVRWRICALLFSAVVLSYVDRLVLGVLKPHLTQLYGWTNSGYADITGYFQVCYGVGFLYFGWLLDRIGPRLGYLWAMGVWTVGHFAQALVTSTTSFAWVRIPLALGEAGTFPSALAATSQWFPKQERALAIGLFNAGANVGAIVTPLVVPIITLALGWRFAFLLTGILNFVWLYTWYRYYRPPTEHPDVSPGELALIRDEPALTSGRATFRQVLGHRQAWAYMLGRFLIDPVWWTFLFWLPDFFNKEYGYNLREFGLPLVFIYLLADVGAVTGGWYSSRLLKLGLGLGRARKTAMFAAALAAVPLAFAGSAPSIEVVVTVIGLACAAHQAFSTNLFAIPGDLFPRYAQGTLVGLGGFSGALGGFLASKGLGWLLDVVGSYRPFLIACGFAYLTAFAVTHLLNREYASARMS